jgi:hypothetical protein
MDKGWFRCAIEELGRCELADVGPLIASLKEPGSDSIIMGFYKFTKRDFVEISYLGNDRFLVWSDRLISPRSLGARLFGSRHVEAFAQGEIEAFEAVKHYLQRPREEFEARYYRARGAQVLDLR